MAPVTRFGLSFARNVSASTSGEDTWTVRQNATIEKITLRFYPGQQLDLHLDAIIVRSQNGGVKDIITPTGGLSYFAGDDDFFEFQVSVPIEKDDEIVVKYDNVDGSNAYDYRVNMELDRTGGVERTLNNILDTVSGVF